MSAALKVFINVRYVTKRDRTRVIVCDLVARGTGGVLYTTPQTLSRANAIDRARKAITRRGYTDTSRADLDA